ncbi:hypothetical protein BB560_000763, partial [Smittium megazygosporum]
MSDVPVSVPASKILEAEFNFASLISDNELLKAQLIAPESQYNQLATELEASKKRDKKLATEVTDLKLKLEIESKANAEMMIQFHKEKMELLNREKLLAQNEAEFYRKQLDFVNRPVATTNHAPLAVPKIPEFNGSAIGFSHWIKWIDDLFNNYPHLTDFNKRIMVVDALKADARNWYDAEPDTSTTSWPQYGGSNSLDAALETIEKMYLSVRSDYNTFIQRIRPAIQQHANETFAMFEQRLRSQHYNLQGKSAKSKTTFNANDLDAMDLGAIATGYRRGSNYTQSTSGYTRSRSPSLFKQRNP